MFTFTVNVPLPAKPKRKSPTGVTTNDLVLSAYAGTNDLIFPLILKLYVAPGAVVADTTYGQGVFWRNVPAGLYALRPTDLKTGIDARHLPYENGTVDAVVFDPPYMHSSGGGAHEGHQNFEGYYRNNKREGSGHEAVLRLYFQAAEEAARVLKPDGIYIVKCQDEVCENRQRLTHVEILNKLCSEGYIAEDLFVLLRNGKPGVSRMLKQIHARKSHSYFLVLRKAGGPKVWKGPSLIDVQSLPLPEGNRDP